MKKTRIVSEKPNSFRKAGIRLGESRFSYFNLFIVFLTLSSCSLVATRPVQEMSNARAALQAAKEVQADILAPDLFQQADEQFFKARREFRYKNFKEAKEYASIAQNLAEKAEFEALLNGAKRDTVPTDPYNDSMRNKEPAPDPVVSPDDYEKTKPMFVEQYEANKKAPAPSPSQPPIPLSPVSPR